MLKYKDSTLPISERVEDLLSHMSLTEKVGQLNQHLYGFKAYDKIGNDFEPNQYFKDEVERFGGIGVLYGLFRADPWSGRTYRNGITVKDSARTANAFQRYVIENTRLGIPVLIATECPHGHQALDGYLFSTNLGAACSFNPVLLENVYAICAKQMRAMGAHLSLTSALDMIRDPRWGRSEECFSEDPFLASAFAKAAVYGAQGRDRDKIGENTDKVMMVAKHLCGQGETTGGINASPASIGERELREIHLPPVKACCEAGVYGFMAAYNEIDGVMCHANRRLLTDILRGEYGFDGVVMADGCALDRLFTLTGDTVKAAALGIKAGVDISLWDDTFTHLEEAVNRNEVVTEELDQAVKRVLTLKFKMGLFENPYVEENNKELFAINYENNNESLKLAQESIVLLKNKDNILPLNKSIKSIAVIGPNADNIYNQLGDYVAEQNFEMTYTVLDGIKKVADKNTVIRYAKGCGIRSKDASKFDEAIEIAKQSEVVIFALGGSSARDFNAKYDSNGAITSNINP
jgi:beta-glucosidase